jgi:predicted acylesterase/phospholipase RssA
LAHGASDAGAVFQCTLELESKMQRELNNANPPGAPRAAAANGHPRSKISSYGQIVLVLQGGGALGAYQAGVYQAMHDAGIEPDWVIGTSIGAINASLRWKQARGPSVEA